MAVNWSDVVNVDASLADVPTATQIAILADVKAFLNATAWVDLYDMAVKYLAAHVGVMSKRTGAGGAGPVVSESLGDASRSYAVPAGAAAYDLGSTPWGQMFARLQGTLTRAFVP